MGDTGPPASGRHFLCIFVYDDSLQYFPMAVRTLFCFCEGLLGQSSLLLFRMALCQAGSSASPRWQITFLESLSKFLQIDPQSELGYQDWRTWLSTPSWEFLDSEVALIISLEVPWKDHDILLYKLTLLLYIYVKQIPETAFDIFGFSQLPGFSAVVLCCIKLKSVPTTT